jgi:hypothetical protein
VGGGGPAEERAPVAAGDGGRVQLREQPVARDADERVEAAGGADGGGGGVRRMSICVGILFWLCSRLCLCLCLGVINSSISLASLLRLHLRLLLLRE